MTARLYYLDDIPTPYRLGVQRKIAEQWPGEFRIAYCAAEEPGRDWSFDFSGLDVEVLPGRQFDLNGKANPFQLKFNPTIADSLAAYRPDVVVMSGYAHPTVQMAAAWCRRHKVPYGVVCESNGRTSRTSGWKWWLKRLLIGPLVRKMAFGLPLGREAGDYLRKCGPFDGPMHYFPNTPDTDAIAGEAARIRREGGQGALLARLGIPEGRKIILFVGRLIEVKRPRDAVEAFLSLGPVADDAVLVFVGAGALEEELKAAAKGDPRVNFAGWLKSPVEMATLMASSAMMVLPSQSETWGAVVNEAMAAGIPVVASDRVGAAVEMIDNGRNGFVHPVSDVQALARSVETLLNDEPLRARLGEAAQQTALAMGQAYAAANLVKAALDATGQNPVPAPKP